MDFDFPLIPLLPLPITLVPASTFAALENSHQGPQFQPGFVSSVSIGISSRNTNGTGNNSYVNNSASSSFSSSSITSSSYDHPSNYPGYATNGSNTSASSHLSDQERLGAIVDALGEASAKVTLLLRFVIAIYPRGRRDCALLWLAKEGRAGVLLPCHLSRVKFINNQTKNPPPPTRYILTLLFIFHLSDDDVTYIRRKSYRRRLRSD